MSLFPLVKPAEAEQPRPHEKLDLEPLLNEMCRYGEPAISRMRKGWWVRCDMHVAAEGTTFKIESEILPSLLTASQQCMDRIQKTLTQYKEMK